MDEIILRCFQKRARKWISNLSRSHRQELLFSTELIKSELLRENNAAGLALLTQYLNIGLDESSNLLIQACGKGWRKVIQTVLKKHDKIAGEVILESINSLVKAKHYALLFCFKEPLKECNLTPSQCTGILDLLYSNCGGSEKITTLLKSVMLIPCFASQVSSSQIFSHLRRNDDTLQIVMSILRNDLYETQVKKIVFEIIREREIDISDTVHELFYDRCSMKNSFVRNTDEFIHYLMDIDYIDESQRTEGMRLCFFQEEIKNQAIAIMIMRKDRTTLSLKFGTSNIFMKICKCHDWFEEAECFLFLNRDDIDEPSLEAGIHNLLQHPKRVLCSTAIMSVIIERRIDIVCGASSVFSLICKGYGDSTSHQILLLKYIMEQHTATIKKQFIDGFNEAICNNIEAAVEICQVFQEQINLSEYILLLFLIDTFTYESAYRIDLIIKLSDILHVDKAMCMKFAHNAIPRKQRWEVLVGLFGSSVKEDMAWKLLCLCCERYPSSLREIFSNSGINLTSQQIEYLKEKYPFVHEYCLLNRLFMFSSNMN